MERVVITGMGIISPLGNDVETFWTRLSRGESGISLIDTLDTTRHKVKIAGSVSAFDANERFGAKEARRMDRFCQFALAAADEAVTRSGLDLNQVNKERMGVYVGSGIGGIQTLISQTETLSARGPERISPTLVPMMIPNMAAALISITYGTRGPTLAPVTACSIGNTAIGEAFFHIQAGRSDVIIAGGTEAALTDISLASFANATALSTRACAPSEASRPFDRDRDGFVMAEGAGILVLESLSHALKRGAPILAEVIGYGASSDAYHMVATPADGQGAALAMQAALAEAGLAPADIDVISAHATSTIVGDRSETAAIKQVFGDHAYRVPVTANKSMTGHMLGASGGAEAIALVKMLEQGLIPPTINLNHPDPECDLDYVPNTARYSDLRIGISNSFGFGGHNSAIVLKRFEHDGK
ncbi:MULTISPECIES: beta-ketoacyl-ACP synthase II [Paenibacillus]|uniref:3-oxoacyl-[acyl-carrier-protein] synthase 2 n=1 Tax=Paenibacillus campinasensis TaxID=66347 RepID=A0A268EV50_9BACL|nr:MULTISPECIES: beta-ketoacyl-ACP synthase II [Paenibacillus]PAD77002.1 beta-ketoacyl-[acyl-carrier-protein] synthase II [Paenibacillus campinasensis]PAK55897.1 beta-ketoacyl-[acyl-carrier-protein] synthase II [Paenibacillus sp. 7541]